MTQDILVYQVNVRDILMNPLIILVEVVSCSNPLTITHILMNPMNANGQQPPVDAAQCVKEDIHAKEGLQPPTMKLKMLRHKTSMGRTLAMMMNSQHLGKVDLNPVTCIVLTQVMNRLPIRNLEYHLQYKLELPIHALARNL
jgi:hypothetical protein